MRVKFRWLLAAAALSMSGNGAAMADALNPSMLPSDTKWLLHLDMDAVVKSDAMSEPIHNFLQEHHMGQHTGHHGGFLSGIHLPEDLHDITIFGTGYQGDTGVTLIEVAKPTEPIDQLTANRPGLQTIDYDGQKILSFHTPRGDVYESSPKPTEILIAHSLDAIKQELDVLTGKSASLSSDSKLLTDNTSGLFFYAAGSGLYQLGVRHTAQSPILSHVDNGWLACSPKGSDLEITGELTALTEQSAVEIQESLLGIAATAELTSEANAGGSQTQPASGTDLNASITASGLNVQIDCVASPDFWLKMLPGPPGPPPGQNRDHGPGPGPDQQPGPGPEQ
ncbi:MAG TPA: hypothetical protein VMG59_07755 [Phycisphaerae bacterium]|nr:hypothetical protein [Phycisphaerae bacterium]